MLTDEQVAELARHDGLLAVAVVPGIGLGLARGPWHWAVRCEPDVLAGARARLVWWRARTTAAPLVAAGVRPRACWDLGAVHRLLTGDRSDSPAAVWAGHAAGAVRSAAGGRTGSPGDGAPGPDVTDEAEQPAAGPAVRADGSLADTWAEEPWADGGAGLTSHPGWHQEVLDAPADGPDEESRLAQAAEWAALALRVQARQAAALADVEDRRAMCAGTTLPVLTAYAESAAALLAVELECDGLPVDRHQAAEILEDVIGPRPVDPAGEAAARQARDATVLRLLAGDPVDLRNPVAVRELLARLGVDVPDTRSWRLEPHRAVPTVAALLDWRRTERTATTYGWGWLDRVDPDGRLRGEWAPADAAAGRMTATAGLHSLPALLRPAVAAQPGHVLVRADLGQVEPRVLAVVSGDEGLASAAREPDLYAPVAAALSCDRPTAKVAVLAAMYGQTSGTAGAALRRMEVAYPRALAHLRAAEQAGLRGEQLRTWGGRLLDFSASDGSPGYGRFARNAVVQGAAAELFKVWAVTVRAGLPPGGQVVLCLHDELLLHVPEAAAGAAGDLLPAALQEAAGRWAAGSGVRFVADVAVVRRWSDAKG